MRGMNHPSIVKLSSFSESPDYYFLVLERKCYVPPVRWLRSCILLVMEGGELFHQIVKLTYFSENLARHVILQVAQGIRYLHEERGVVHRLVSPQIDGTLINLLVQRHQARKSALRTNTHNPFQGIHTAPV